MQNNNEITKEEMPATEKQIIAQNIAFFRKKLNISQTELAKRLQYSNKNVSKWERAETTPDIFTLKKLAVIFGVSIDTIVNPITEENKQAIKTKTVVPTKWKVYMLLLTETIILLMTCIAFFILKSLDAKLFAPEAIFLYITPILDLTVFIFLCCIRKKVDLTSLSLLGWLIAVCCHFTYWNVPNILYIYLIAAAYQLLAIFMAKLINSGKIIKFNKILIKKLKRD